jgi:hypothetical protein
MNLRRFFTAMTTVLWAGVMGTGWAQQTVTAPASPAPRDAPAIDEVTIRALRQIDPRTLDRVLVPKFVESHGVSSPKTDQVARWYGGICPETKGLQARSNDFVTRRIVALAHSVGAPTKPAGSCKTNVEILFTADPRAQLDYVVHKKSGLLGMASVGQKDLTTFDHPIQAWYETQTRSYAVIVAENFNAPPVGHRDSLRDNPQNLTVMIENGTHGSSPQMGGGGTQIDSPDALVRGVAGSYLGSGVVSEFANVLIIIDTNQVRAYPLTAVADYVAVLVLTHASLAGCNRLPSVMDLLSPDCGTQPHPQAVTSADTAYLQALYSSNLESKLALEQGEMHDRMLKTIVGH